MQSAEDETGAEDVERKSEVNGVLEKDPEIAQDKQHAPREELSVTDDFGLPVRPARRRQWPADGEDSVNGQSDGQDDSDAFEDAQEKPVADSKTIAESNKPSEASTVEPESPPAEGIGTAAETSRSTGSGSKTCMSEQPTEDSMTAVALDVTIEAGTDRLEKPSEDLKTAVEPAQLTETQNVEPQTVTLDDVADRPIPGDGADGTTRGSRSNSQASPVSSRSHAKSIGASEWSHQKLAPQPDIEEEDDSGDDWKQMPAYATHRIYDDWGKVLAKEYGEGEDEQVAYGNLGGAGKGYTRVQVDDDAESATSMDDNTAYLFKEPHSSNVLDEDEEGRDVLSQMQTTKELLTEGQRIAYVGIVRLSIGKMLGMLDELPRSKHAKKHVEYAMEALKMWGQKIMVRLYGHMDISSAEQVMVEQLAEHGVLPSDLTPALMQSARVKNPAKVESETSSIKSARPSIGSPRPSSTFEKRQSTQNLSAPGTPGLSPTPPPPPTYEEHAAADLTIEDPTEFERAQNLDIDIRWTILCDLFLLLVADSTYDSRSRTLLEHVGESLSVPWQEVGRFEKRVTDALEMQEQADKENWNEDEHLVARKKAARNRRLMVMGMCTVGGGLVIGLSAGMLAPVIGAGLAAGFTAIGVTGTSTFLGGAGAAALIGTAGTATGGFIGVRASSRRTGAVKTFEYRPLFNNKRTNLVVTVAGWMTGKVDDVRLPFSTVDPIMGDIYSINWEPEMLQSTGQTIQILGTEALTQTIQQILAATFLTTLMAGLSAPIVLAKLSYLIDNPWTVSLARADSTGLILADSLIDRNLGVRPITLVGFSLGTRVIFSCLKELAKRGALGLVQSVYLFGSPIVANKDEYMRARTVVSGRFVNGYATNDWILGYLFRATSGGIMKVSGLTAVEGVPGIENKDFTGLVAGHMAYRAKMPALLQECGWFVDSLEFTEIEDADPENHEKRQRELIDEIEAARHELDATQEDRQKKGGLRAFFSRKKAPQKKPWETYDERSQKVLEGDENEAERVAAENTNVMFDVDAIRQEALKLALQGEDIEEIKKHLHVREIESTMPALKVASEYWNLPKKDTSTNGGAGTPPPQNPSVQRKKSHDEYTFGQHVNGASGSTTAKGNTALDERPSLSFEEAPERPSSASLDPPIEHPSPSTSPSPDPNPSPHQPEDPRPSRTAATAAVPVNSSESRKMEVKDPTHNPWGDDEEMEFGTEKDVQMSFE